VIKEKAGFLEGDLAFFDACLDKPFGHPGCDLREVAFFPQCFVRIHLLYFMQG
jgi:hypothetical protein